MPIEGHLLLRDLAEYIARDVEARLELFLLKREVPTLRRFGRQFLLGLAEGLGFMIAITAILLIMPAVFHVHH